MHQNETSAKSKLQVILKSMDEVVILQPFGVQLSTHDGWGLCLNDGTNIKKIIPK